MLRVFVHVLLKATFILAFLPVVWEFSLVSLYLLEETCKSLESPIHSEDNGFCLNSVHKSICKLPPYN